MNGRYAAGTAHYRGDMRSIVGETKGPTTFGTWLFAHSADYDQQADQTTVRFTTIEMVTDPEPRLVLTPEQYAIELGAVKV